jgi:addiction module RelE/StbE family toxin
MDCKLIVSEFANSDLDGIVEYIIKDLKSPNAASNLLDEIEKCYTHLRKNPLMYEKCTDARLKKDGYRKAVIKNYLLIYRFEEETKTVQVARFFYGGRNYAKFL